MRAKPNAPVFLAVGLMHGLLIWSIAREDRRKAEHLDVVSVWLNPRDVVLPTPPPIPEPATAESERKRRPTISSTTSAPSTPSTAITPEGPSTPDWHASGTAAAGAAVDRIVQAEKLRSFGPREPKKAQPPEPSIFEKPKHERGDLGEDALGYKSVWLNDKCYTALEKPMSMVGRTAMILGATMCMYPIGKKPARGDLFEGMESNEETER